MNTSSLYEVCFVLICLWNGVPAQMKGVTRTEFLQAFLEDYDSRIPPSFDFQHATNVYVKVAFENIYSISEQTMDFSSSLLITQEWTDHRLEFFGLIEAPYLELDSKMIARVWVPDLYFANEKRAHFHDITVPNRMMHLYSNGTVIYQARVTLTASCPMSLHRYPMDSQVCSLKLKSFAYSKSNVIFHWHDEHPISTDILELPQFRLVDYMVHNCCHTTQNCSSDELNDTISCLRVDLCLEREIGYYMIQMYIPSIMIVALSWVSFWLSIDAVPARISLGILTVLTMTTQKTAAISSLPKVSYVKAIDVWMAACLSFVFSSLLEYALVNVLLRREVKRRCSIVDKSGISLINIKSQDPDAERALLRSLPERKTAQKWIIDPRGKQRARFLDKAARLFFPLSFVTFCGIYWIVYCVF